MQGSHLYVRISEMEAERSPQSKPQPYCSAFKSHDCVFLIKSRLPQIMRSGVMTVICVRL